MNTDKWYGLECRPEDLTYFLKEIQKSDEMGGNHIELVKLMENGKFVVLFTRIHNHPFVIDELEKWLEEKK